MKEYEIYSLRRSGSLFITEWILSHFEYGYHKNSIRSNEPSQYIVWKNNTVTHCINPDILPEDWVVPDEDYDVVLSSYEDESFTEITENTIIILRDWYNTWASRIKSNRYKCSGGNPASIYLNYCKFYDIMPENVILYNKLVVDEEYAKEVERRFGWKHVPVTKKLPKSKIGAGSSFSGGHLKVASVNDRYKSTENHPAWPFIMSNHEINSYMEKIFNICPDVPDIKITETPPEATTTAKTVSSRPLGGLRSAQFTLNTIID